MNDLFQNLWICPLCSAEHSVPVITCQRCQCQILLFNKIKLTAYALQQKGYTELSKRFYDRDIDIS